MNEEKKKLKVAVVGGGLVGALSASFFARRGHDVSLYEYREDIRKSEVVQGRSINLSMSNRGREALRVIGLEDVMVKHGIPMYCRMIHRTDGTTRAIPYDTKSNQAIYSVGRRYLNEVLLTAAENAPNIKVHFCHKFISANLLEGRMKLQQTEDGAIVDETADLIVGADGAFSAVRREMLKQPMFDFSQTYIEHGYMELCIPPTTSGDYAMPKNFLHLWPRGSFMMIALPNQDQSWTVTLFMPFKTFNSLDTPELLLNFFETNFPDAVPLIGKDRLIKDFFLSTPSPLVSIKCRPYHVGQKAIIIGDAAHAMVPFYGQGMNAGFEDCILLDNLMVDYNDNLALVLQEFSATRNKDAEAICDLALYNYIEMRSLVNKRSYFWRKKLDEFLFWIMPNVWVPLYPSVTFTNMRYHQCIANKKWQDKTLTRSMLAVGVVGTVVTSLIAYNFQEYYMPHRAI